MVSTPAPPNAQETANAQSGMNRDTAIAQNSINMTNQVNPWGSVNYDQTGSTGYTDSSGKWVSIPQFTQTATYNPEQQQIFDQTTQAQQNISGLASDQSAKLRDYLDKPYSFDNQDAADWSYDLAQTRIAPQQQQAQKALEAQLVNKGIRPGSEAWNSEMRRLTNANTDQNNQLALTGRSQAFGESMATRNQPINEITALLSGSQIANPGAMSPGTPQSSVAGVDYTGLVNSNYQAELANSGGLMGGLFGLAGSLGGAAIKKGLFSDERVKTDISRVGTLDNGLPVFSYRYVWGGPMQIGVMAQDVEKLHPEAVFDVGGIKAVDYGMAVR